MGNKVQHRLDVEDRMVIQACLHDHRTLEQIATRVHVSKSTISRELKRNGTIESPTSFKCPALKTIIVCNTCKKKALCNKQKRYYNFKQAHELASSRNHLSRSIPKLKVEAIKDIDHIVTAGVRLGQSLHHIYVGDKQLQNHCCERTIRRLVYRGNLGVRPHELRRYVRFKREYKKELADLQIRDIRALIGRTHKDYVRYCQAHKSLNIVQYDSLIGKKEDHKAILTITFPAYNFQFGLLIHKSHPASVNHVLRKLFATLGNDIVKKVFPINLCDNGVEFSHFHQLEANPHGEMILRTFYTNPYRSTDKAEAERNHEFVRYCLAKGKSLNELTQPLLDEMFSHINSYTRKSKQDKTPYDLVKARFGKSFLNSINIVRIPNKKVKLIAIV
jgi:transposase, IS30 family